MRCPRCGEEYDKYNVEASIYEVPDVAVNLWCDACNTTVRFKVTQALLNKLWVNTDQDNLRDATRDKALNDTEVKVLESPKPRVYDSFNEVLNVMAHKVEAERD